MLTDSASLPCFPQSLQSTHGALQQGQPSDSGERLILQPPPVQLHNLNFSLVGLSFLSLQGTIVSPGLFLEICKPDMNLWGF